MSKQSSRQFTLLPVLGLIGGVVVVASLSQMLTQPHGVASVWNYWMWEDTGFSSMDSASSESSSEELSNEYFMESSSSEESSDSGSEGDSSSMGSCTDANGSERDWLTGRLQELQAECGGSSSWGALSVLRMCDRSDHCGSGHECAAHNPDSGMDSEPVCVPAPASNDLEAQVAQFVDVPCAPDRIRVRVKVWGSNPPQYVSICIRFSNTTPNKELAISGGRIVVREVDQNGKAFYVNIGPEGKAMTLDNNTDGLKLAVGQGGELQIDLQDRGEGVKPQYLKVVKGTDGYYKLETRPTP